MAKIDWKLLALVKAIAFVSVLFVLGANSATAGSKLKVVNKNCGGQSWYPSITLSGLCKLYSKTHGLNGSGATATWKLKKHCKYNLYGVGPVKKFKARNNHNVYYETHRTNNSTNCVLKRIGAREYNSLKK